MSQDERLRFYDTDDPRRHGFGDLAADRSAVLDLLSETGPHSLVLEVGCGTGRLADLHPRWFGIDFAHAALARHVPGRSAQGDACALPIASGSATFVFTLQALEHVPTPGAALAEIDRVIAPGGTAYLHPAWYCSAWPMDPLRRASWRDLPPGRRLRKAARAARYSRPARLPGVLARKVWGELCFSAASAPRPLPFRSLTPNLEAYDVPDADASAGLEPAFVAHWFLSRGYEPLTFGGRLERLTWVRGAVVMRKPGHRIAAAEASGLEPVAGWLRCPLCHATFIDGADAVQCGAGHVYPVEGGVPRLIEAHRRD